MWICLFLRKVWVVCIMDKFYTLGININPRSLLDQDIGFTYWIFLYRFHRFFNILNAQQCKLQNLMQICARNDRTTSSVHVQRHVTILYISKCLPIICPNLFVIMHASVFPVAIKLIKSQHPQCQKLIASKSYTLLHHWFNLIWILDPS